MVCWQIVGVFVDELGGSGVTKVNPEPEVGVSSSDGARETDGE
jgi:hypothetical protein